MGIHKAKSAQIASGGLNGDSKWHEY
jgi:hypothetical protein